MVDGVRRSKLLIRLDAEIAQLRPGLQADCKRAERAAYHARLGQLAGARAEIVALRHIYDSQPNVAISAWLNLVGGLVSHFSEINSGARQLMLRAHALSAASNERHLQALSAAWLSHLDYLQPNVLSMANYAKEALLISTPLDHSIRSRVSLVIAQAYHLAARLDLAMPWYLVAHDHAIAEGDDTTVSAIMHNMAWLRAQRLRASECGLAPPLSPVEEHALSGTDSTASFDLLIGSTSWPAGLNILRAQILTVRGEYALALQLFETELEKVLVGGLARLQADFLADRAWCKVQLQRREAALADAEKAEGNINAMGSFDDIALTSMRLAQVFDNLGLHERAGHRRSLATTAWAGHVSMQHDILQALESIGNSNLN
jgi:hypothetical protein